MMKKSVLLVLFTILIASSVLAQASKMEISPTKEAFSSGEKIALRVSLYDEQNNPIDDEINLVIQDASKQSKTEVAVQSNKLVDIELDTGAPSGFWTISASYQGLTSSALFSIENNEAVKFEIVNDTLTITNTGNTRYIETVQIAIGDTIGSKQLDLDVGEKASFRLVAPSGTYSVRVTDGKTTLTKGGISLTGNVIGVLDRRAPTGSAITGGIREGEDQYGETPQTNPRNKSMTYIFLLGLLGAVILLAVERRYRKKAALAGY